MKAFSKKLVPVAACTAVLLLVHVLMGAWLVNEDPLDLKLTVLLGVVVLVGARLLLLFVMPGFWLYVLAREFLAHLARTRGADPRQWAKKRA